MSLWVSASILLSAVTYLFDFGSNVVIAAEYGARYARFMRLERSPGRCDDLCRRKTSELAGYFWGMLIVLLLSHTLNALIFRFRFGSSSSSYKAAYFLPLMHLWRLIDLVRTTLSWSGAAKLRCPDMNGLFSILGSSMEGMPMLILQFVSYISLHKYGLLPDMSVLFKLSVVASLLSAAYNGGSSVQTVAANATSFAAQLEVAISAGLFTMFASLARCLTYTNIIYRIRAYYSERRSLRSTARFHGTDIFPVAFLVGSITIYWVYYLKQVRERSLKRCMSCLTFAYMSMIVGPLYATVSQARETNELGSMYFELKLFIVGTLSVCTDLLVVLLTYMLGKLPAAYAFISLASALGCAVSLVWYIRVDALCGPVELHKAQDEEDSSMNSNRSNSNSMNSVNSSMNSVNSSMNSSSSMNSNSMNSNSMNSNRINSNRMNSNRMNNEAHEAAGDGGQASSEEEDEEVNDEENDDKKMEDVKKTLEEQVELTFDDLREIIVDDVEETTSFDGRLQPFLNR